MFSVRRPERTGPTRTWLDNFKLDLSQDEVTRTALVWHEIGISGRFLGLPY
jgi:hypothetical protein